ncbi:CaiB/BaiF CoA transferase family protein [Nocardioides insulae]|uniref:CaiB/BaiF CoA transferase family protein n=1 Tax=Nocardioides insulae TaxID=394734 RepID=UPI000411C1BD|nr:CaiB/BaiF CoA-transferase family protein [Nocardioides insulae]
MDKPLTGVHVIEMAGIGPGPHAAMILSDLGATVTRIDRPGSHVPEDAEHSLRGREVQIRDLKNPDDIAAVLDLIAGADVLLEGLRPGVMERLGLGPETALERNPRLVYARMTGWGQDGPWAKAAGHDINYISLTGALHAIGPKDHPVPPLNLVGDFGGGSMLVVQGILAALVQRGTTGKGQVVDAAMVDGVSVLLQLILELRAGRGWTDGREENMLDGGAPFYRTYRCADDGFMAVGAIEPQFYALLIKGLGLEADQIPDRNDKGAWPELHKVLEEAFIAQPRAHWEGIFDATDACVSPVLSFEEAVEHPHMAARSSLRRGKNGDVVAGIAPRFSDPQA